MLPCPEIPHRHPLSLWVERLPELQERLTAAGFGIGPDRWLNLQDLLFRFYQEGRLPPEIRGLCKFIRPLFCRNPEESAAFDNCFDAWVDEGRKASLPAAEPIASPYAEPAPSPPPELGKLPVRPFRRWPLAVLVVLLSLLFLGAGYWLLKPPAPEPLVEPSTEQSPPSASQPAIPKGPKPPAPALSSDDYLELPLQPLPPRALPERPFLDPQAAAYLEVLGKLLPWLGLPIALAWLIWSWWRRRYVLRRAEDSGQDPLASLAMHTDSQPLFAAPPVRDALRRLHRPIAIPGRSLDTRATIAASIRQAGCFQPIRRGRRFAPELLVFIDTRDPKDLLTDLGRLVAERLRQQGHQVFVYTYQGAPNGFVDETGQVVPGGTEGLFHHHPHARLLLIGDPNALLTNLGTHLTAAANALTRWPRRGLLSTRDPHPTWLGILTAAGFYAEPLTSEGLRAISAQLTDLPQPAETWRRSISPPAPFQDRHTLLWRRRPRRGEFKADLAALRRYLGPDGYFLLSAMAVYPALHWGLTQILDSRLFPDATGERREQRLTRLAQLTWSRIGWLPEWFRIDLLRRLTRRQRRAIRREFHSLLDPRATTTGNTTIRLPFRIAKTRPWREGGWRDWLEGLIARAPEHSRLKDAVFANLVLGGRLGLWDFTLPRWIGYRLPGGHWQLWLGPLLKAGAGVLLFGLAATHLWQAGPVRTLAEDWMLERRVAASQGQRFAIVADARNEMLAAALRASLVRYGLTQEVLQPEVVERLSRLPGTDHRIEYGPDAGDATRRAARTIAARLAYLDYRSPKAIGSRTMAAVDGVPKNTILVQLAGDAAADPTVSVRDRYSGGKTARALSPEEKRLFGDPGQLIAAIDKAPFSRFRDSLASGGQGPEMVVVPTGEFLMGSPPDEPELAGYEGPQHLVRIPRPFALGVTEVTFADYDRFARATGRGLPNDAGWGRGKRPVINVSWDDAGAYAEWLSRETGAVYRLPTEAEWEYAARAGTRTPFWTGDCIHTDQANYDGNYDYNDCGAKTGIYRQRTVPAGSLPANPWRLHEIAGNVWEWTQDCWHGSYRGAPSDGSAWGQENGDDCTGGVVRGGGWGSRPWDLRSADRFRGTSDGAGGDLGFRLAREL
ncbi:formylglycine-generating enzyme family protein [Candidatus Thiosymbion oneisti]|uniref:formylglycine-generating enzyme family protein n=1 Tax=Candidatus Thiosymbion oneisti TaxID=589554 RepID=UPI000AE45CB4|nr:formylglycine-generating enzyme family protein [Candidatus Thiosymbion oneisti]